MSKRSLYQFMLFSFVWLQVTSLLYQLFFWRNFGVDIFHYISVNDLVFSSGDYLINFITIMFLWWFFVQFLPSFEQYFDMEAKSWFPGVSAFIGLFVFLMICSSYIPVKYVNLWVGAVIFSAALLRDVAGLLVRPLGILTMFDNSRTGYLYLSVVLGSILFTIPFSNWEARKIVEDDLHTISEVRYLKIDGCDDCYMWVLGRLGDYVFAYSSGRDRVMAIPDSKIESITHHFK